MNTSSIQLVVARYRENLNWLNNIPSAVETIVYDKSGEDSRPGSQSLPNVGREAHTYLWHIVHHYEQLADITVFCQGKPFDHAYDFHRTLREVAQHPEVVPAFQWLGHGIDTDSSDGALFKAWSKNPEGNELDLNGYYRALFGVEGPEEYTFYMGGQFLARRELIRSRPLEFWQKALEISASFFEAAHCFERTWDRIFGVVGVSPDLLAGRKTVYLKPVKRLDNEG